MEKSEIDAEIGEDRPRDQGGGRKNHLMIGGKNGRQKDRQKPGQPQHRAIKQLAVAGFHFVVDRLPEINPGEALGREFRHIGNRLPRLQRDAEHIGLIAFDALRHKADRGRDCVDTAGVEVWPDRARAYDGIPVGGQPAFQRLIGFVGEREHHPIRIGARHRGPDRHAARDTVGTGCRLDLQAIATAFIGFAERGDFGAL